MQNKEDITCRYKIFFMDERYRVCVIFTVVYSISYAARLLTLLFWKLSKTSNTFLGGRYRSSSSYKQKYPRVTLTAPLREYPCAPSFVQSLVSFANYSIQRCDYDVCSYRVTAHTRQVRFRYRSLDKQNSKLISTNDCGLQSVCNYTFCARHTRAPFPFS